MFQRSAAAKFASASLMNGQGLFGEASKHFVACLDLLWLCVFVASFNQKEGSEADSPTGLTRRLHKKYGRMSTQEVPEWTHTLLLPLASFCSEAGRQWVGPPLLKLTFWTFWTFTSPNEPLCAFFGLGHHRPFLKLSCEASQKFPAPHQQLGSTQKKNMSHLLIFCRIWLTNPGRL